MTLQNNNILDIFDIYLKDLRSTQLNEKTELSDRSALEKLLKVVSAENKNIHILHEPKRDKNGLGSPDFRIKEVESILGYVETKKIGENIEILIDSDQIKKYCKLSSNILLTNYVDFIWINGDRHIKEASLGSSHNLLKSKLHIPNQNNVLEVNNLLKGFFSSPPIGISKAKELAKQLAPRSRILRDYFLEKLEETGNKDIIQELYEAFKIRVFKELRMDEFANVFAQMISYGLFLARLHTDGDVVLSVNNAKMHIPKSFELIKQMVRFLDELHTKEYEEIRWVVDEIFSIINTFDFKAIQHDLEFNKKSSTNLETKPIKDPYVYFYEDFLQEYDPELRRIMGVYYTPIPIVKFIINSVEDILKETFKIEHGFADRNVTALDFATGTGTFLVEMFKNVLSALPIDSGKRNFVIQNHLLKNFYGFEYMIAPYAIAHIKLSEFLKEQGYELKDHERLGVYLTNTLEPAEKSSTQFSLPGLDSLDRESEEAREIKKKTILVIVGNPPYSGVSRHHTPGLIEPYKQVDGKPLNEKKTWLNDDYVKFIRFAQNKMDQVEEGIVGIITNHGFLNNPTFRGMRQSLMNTFQQIYTLDLHGNSKRLEKCPDGSKDENVFDIQQGVCITFFIKKKGIETKILHADLWGNRDNKFRFCNKETLRSINWEQLIPVTPNYFFVPWNNDECEKYNEYWPLKSIFTQTSVGIVTGRDSLTIDIDEDKLVNRVKDFVSLPIEVAREKYNLGKDSRDWKVSFAQKSLEESSVSKVNIRDINYRPFDIRKIYYTTKSKGFIGQPLYNTMRHMLAGDNIGLVTVRQVAEQRYNHVFISDNMIESRITLSNRGTASLIPLYVYQEPAGDLFGAANLIKVENLSPSFRYWLDQHYQYHYSPEEILGYIYAILNSSVYRSRYLEFLKMDFPRIPFTDDRKIFEELAAIGWGLIQAHLMKDSVSCTLGSYIGQGNDLVDKISYNPVDQKLFVNPTQYFADVPQEVWEFCIGGYQVLDKYLKSRKKRALTIEEIVNVEKIINILAFTIQQMSKIDEIYKKMDQEN